MATYFVSNSGSNTSPYDTWAKAATSLQTALTAATAAGDVVVIQYDGVPSGDAQLAADTTYTFAGDIFLISASNDGGSAFTPTAMGTANWIGNSTTNRGIIFTGADRKCSIWGLTLRVSGSTADNLTLINASGQSFTYTNCYFWMNTSSGSVLLLQNSSGTFVRCEGCTFRFGSTGQTLRTTGAFSELLDCSISPDGSAPTTLLSVTGAAGSIRLVGCDLSHVTGTLVGDAGNFFDVILERCSLGSGVTPMAAQTSNPTAASARVTVLDCASGDTHGLFGYYNAFGSVVSETGIYFTSGAAGQSWKVTTTANASRCTPFVSPWIDLYNTGTSAITPYVEILRDGSTAALTNQDVWLEVSAKGISGSTQGNILQDDADALADLSTGTNANDQAAGAGLGSWTGESGAAWSGKIDSGSSLTPAEVGYIRARVYVALTSSTNTLYIDPQIRT